MKAAKKQGFLRGKNENVIDNDGLAHRRSVSTLPIQHVSISALGFDCQAKTMRQLGIEVQMAYSQTSERALVDLLNEKPL